MDCIATKLIFLVTIWTVSSQDLTQEVTSSLLSLVAQESELRSRLEDEANLLEQKLAELTKQSNGATCACPSSFGPIAFSATLTSNLATLGRGQAIVYKQVDVNAGNAYDVRHGIFTAPIDGVYEFTTAVLNRPGISTGLEIVKNGISCTKVKSGDDSYYTMGTNAVALDLQAGDEVWVRHVNESDSQTINGEGYTTFSGYFIEGYEVVNNQALSG
ncbi:hypothetical protein ACF0H5_014381 [Mactra antiquata]